MRRDARLFHLDGLSDAMSVTGSRTEGVLPGWQMRINLDVESTVTPMLADIDEALELCARVVYDDRSQAAFRWSLVSSYWAMPSMNVTPRSSSSSH